MNKELIEALEPSSKAGEPHRKMPPPGSGGTQKLDADKIQIPIDAVHTIIVCPLDRVAAFFLYLIPFFRGILLTRAIRLPRLLRAFRFAGVTFIVPLFFQAHQLLPSLFRRLRGSI